MEGINFKTPQYKYYLTPRQYPIQVAVEQDIERDDIQTFAKAGILQVFAMVLAKASEWCGKKLMQGKEFTTAENVKKIADEMLFKNNLKDKVAVKYIDSSNVKHITNAIKTNSGLDMTKELETVARGANAFYSDNLKLAVAPSSKPSLILHELGHAITAHKGKFMKFMQNSRMMAASIPTLLLIANSMIPKKQGEETFIEKHAGKIGFCAFLPTILEEGLASLRGIKAANTIKKSINMNLKPLKRNYTFAWLTYVISGLGLGIAAKQSILENKQ